MSFFRVVISHSASAQISGRSLSPGGADQRISISVWVSQVTSVDYTGSCLRSAFYPLEFAADFLPDHGPYGEQP